MKTAVFNVRLDIRALATLHRHYSAKGYTFDSVSTLVRRLIETQANVASTNQFVTIEEALNYLHSEGLMGPIKPTKTLIQALQRETLLAEELDPSYLNRKTINNVDEDQIEAAKRIFKQKEEESSGAILGLRPGEIKK